MPSVPKTTIVSYEELDRKLLEIGRYDSLIKKSEARMNQLIQNIKEKHEQDTADARAQKSLLEQEVESFCLANKADFNNQRTKTFVHGKVSFRTNPPKVVQLNKKFTIKTSLEFLKKLFPSYVRSKEEIDKEKILSDYAAGTIKDDNLAGVGLRVDQDETLTIEPDWEELKSEAAV